MARWTPRTIPGVAGKGNGRWGPPCKEMVPLGDENHPGRKDRLGRDLGSPDAPRQAPYTALEVKGAGSLREARNQGGKRRCQGCTAPSLLPLVRAEGSYQALSPRGTDSDPGQTEAHEQGRETPERVRGGGGLREKMLP